MPGSTMARTTTETKRKVPRLRGDWKGWWGSNAADCVPSSTPAMRLTHEGLSASQEDPRDGGDQGQQSEAA